MKRFWNKATLLAVVLTELVGALAGLLTRRGTELYNVAVQKPSFSPPPIVFPLVWSVLYALMGVSVARIWRSERSLARRQSLRLYGVQLGFNFFWSLIFFNLQAYGFALLWLAALWALVAAMLRAFSRVDRAAAWLQVPYLLWVSFAAVLNAAVWRLNR